MCRRFDGLEAESSHGNERLEEETGTAGASQGESKAKLGQEQVTLGSCLPTPACCCCLTALAFEGHRGNLANIYFRVNREKKSNKEEEEKEQE